MNNNPTWGLPDDSSEQRRRALAMELARGNPQVPYSWGAGAARLTDTIFDGIRQMRERSFLKDIAAAHGGGGLPSASVQTTRDTQPAGPAAPMTTDKFTAGAPIDTSTGFKGSAGNNYKDVPVQQKLADSLDSGAQSVDEAGFTPPPAAAVHNRQVGGLTDAAGAMDPKAAVALRDAVNAENKPAAPAIAAPDATVAGQKSTNDFADGLIASGKDKLAAALDTQPSPPDATVAGQKSIDGVVDNLVGLNRPKGANPAKLADALAPAGETTINPDGSENWSPEKAKLADALNGAQSVDEAGFTTPTPKPVNAISGGMPTGDQMNPGLDAFSTQNLLRPQRTDTTTMATPVGPHADMAASLQRVAAENGWPASFVTDAGKLIKGESNFQNMPPNSHGYAGYFQMRPSEFTADGQYLPNANSYSGPKLSNSDFAKMPFDDQLKLYTNMLGKSGYDGTQNLGVMNAAPAYRNKPDNFVAYPYGSREEAANRSTWGAASGGRDVTVGGIKNYYDRQPAALSAPQPQFNISRPMGNSVANLIGGQQVASLDGGFVPQQQPQPTAPPAESAAVRQGLGLSDAAPQQNTQVAQNGGSPPNSLPGMPSSMFSPNRMGIEQQQQPQPQPQQPQPGHQIQANQPEQLSIAAQEAQRLYNSYSAMMPRAQTLQQTQQIMGMMDAARQQYIQALSAQKFGFQTLPDGTIVRTNPMTGSVTPVYQTTKPTFVPNVTHDRYGLPIGGFVDPTTQSVKIIGQDGQPVQPGQQAAQNPMTLTGDDYLKTLDPAKAILVKKIAEGRAPYPTAGAQKTPYGQHLVEDIGQYDPDGMVTYPSRLAQLKNYQGGGKQYQELQAISTVAGHLHDLMSAADGLHNGSYPLLNSIENNIRQATGNPAVDRFNTVKQAVTTELSKAYRGGHVTEGDVHQWQDNLTSAKSPEQLRSVIGQLNSLLMSKRQAMEEGFKSTMGKFQLPAEFSTVNARTQSLFNDVDQWSRGGNAPQSSTQNSAPGSSQQQPQTMSPVEAEMRKRGLLR